MDIWQVKIFGVGWCVSVCIHRSSFLVHMSTSLSSCSFLAMFSSNCARRSASFCCTALRFALFLFRD